MLDNFVSSKKWSHYSPSTPYFNIITTQAERLNTAFSHSKHFYSWI
uniref:Uncharacterized protein n=1 Tax=Anguilla anguilla TaxID=7936 RepID=A0A0E9S1F8_ANGAN